LRLIIFFVKLSFLQPFSTALCGFNKQIKRELPDEKNQFLTKMDAIGHLKTVKHGGGPDSGGMDQRI